MKSIILERKTSYGVLASFFMITFSAYFMTNILSISPVYLTTLLGLFFLALKTKYYLKDISFFVYSLHILYSLSFLINCIINNTSDHDAIVLFFFGLYYIFSDLSLNQVTEKSKFIKLIKIYFLFFVIYSLIDFKMRISYGKTQEIPTWIAANPLYLFYLYKNGGLCGDSNTIGAFALCLFCFVFYARIKLRISFVYCFISFALCFISFSRASIFACILLVLYHYFFIRQNIYVKFIFVVIGFIFFVYFVSYIASDPSFLTKLEIFTKTTRYLKNCNVFQFLFGIGANRSFRLFGIYAHNIWSILFVEYGIIQVILFVLLLIFTCIDIGEGWSYIIFPYMFLALSYTPIFLPFFLVSLAMIKYINKFSIEVS